MFRGRTQYLDAAEHINHYYYSVTAPASYTKLSRYEMEFNLESIYNPTSIHMNCNTAVTIANMIDMHSNGIVFSLQCSDDCFEIFEKVKLYTDQLSANNSRTTLQEAYLKKANSFLKEIEKTCKIHYRRIHKEDKPDIASISGILQFVSNLVRK